MDALPNVLTRLQRQGKTLGHFKVADLVRLKVADEFLGKQTTGAVPVLYPSI